MGVEAATVVVITDANILINFVHIGQLPLLGALDAYRFQVPVDVIAEILDEDQRDALSEAIAAGYLEEVVVDTVDAVALFAELRDVMGRGEAACLALVPALPEVAERVIVPHKADRHVEKRLT